MRVIVCLIFALSACAGPVVRCEKHLQPINAPAPKPAAAASDEISP